MPRISTRISKTRFQGGLRCARRLWLESYRRELAPPPDRATRMRLAGTQNVIAIAKMNDGSVFVDKKLVKVTIGGCGG